MNILLDFIPLQYAGGIGGAASFTKSVLDGVLSRRSETTFVFVMIDSTKGTNRRFDYLALCRELNVEPVDIANRRIANVVNENKIDVLFISIGQWFAEYDLNGINCKTIMFIHDIFDCERHANRIDMMLFDKNKEGLWTYAKRIINVVSGRWERKMHHDYEKIIPLYNSPNTLAYTVSDYSRNALRYFFPQIKKDIRVCWSPLMNANIQETIGNETLAQLVKSGKPYLLLLSAHRRYKNPATVMNVYKRLQVDYPDLHLLSLKYGKSIANQHVDIDFLSDSDLQAALRNAKCLVFSSYFEGFGYPPVEAMRYGTPVVASNVTSIPEVVGDGGEYCSPYYPADVYRAIRQVLENESAYKAKALARYQFVTARQEHDFDNLLNEFFITDIR